MKNKLNASLSLRKVILSALVTAPLATLPAQLWALPTSQSGLNSLVTLSSGVTASYVNNNRVDVNSTAQTSVIKWTDFGGGANTISNGQQINFTLPSSSASILNTVTGANSTTINGLLNSNGNIYILNPNGITIGSTGVIVANGVGLSTIPETEYNFLATGKLSYIASTPATNPVNVSPGAVIKAASGTGNVWITAAGANLAGTIDAGNVSVTTQNNGSVALGTDGTTAGTLVIGDTTANAGNLSVSTNGTGTITVGTATPSGVTVYGSGVSLTTGNTAITQPGGSLTINPGTAGNATLTTNSGTADTTLNANAAGGTLTVSSTGNNVTLVDGSGNLTVGGNVAATLTATTTGGNVTLNGPTANALTVSSSAGISSIGNTTVKNAASLTAANGQDITFAGKAGSLAIQGASGRLGNVTINDTGDLALGTITATNLTATAAGNVTQSNAQDVTGGSASISSTGGTVTLTQGITASDLTVTTTAAKDIDTSGVALTNVNSATINSAGNVTVGVITAPAVSVTGTGNVTISGDLGVSGTPLNSVTLSSGNTLAIGASVYANTVSATTSKLTETGAIISGGTTTLDATTSIAAGGNNDFATLVIKNAPSGATANDINGIVLGNGTNASGNVTITAGGAVQLGAAATDSLSVAGNLTATATGADITEPASTVDVLGSVNLTTATSGNVMLNGSNNQLGQVNITTAGNGNATVDETTTLNLGNISIGTGTLTAYSNTSIVNNGQLSTGAIVVGAGTAAAPGDISLNYDSSSTHNAIGGRITLQQDIVGNYLAKSLTVTNGVANADLVYIPANSYGNGTSANVSVTAIKDVNLGVGAINTTGDVSLTTSGAGTLTAGALTANAVTLSAGTGAIAATSGNSFGTATVTAGGGAQVSSTTDLTINGTISGATATTFTSSGNLTIGSFTSSNTASTSFTATKAITDSQPGISIYGDVALNGGSVSITKSGHNFGKLSVTTTNNGAATIVESGTSNYASVTTGSGAFTATSSNGNIIENGGAGTITSSGSVTLSAPNGAVTANGTGNAMTGAIGITAQGNSAIINTANTSLGNTTVSTGGLSVDLSATGSTNISEAGNATIYTYGATSFTTGGTGTITVANTGNQFGAMSLTTAGGNATVKEWTTLNLKSVNTMGGALTATSEGGDVIDSGAILATGTAAFSAPNGNITLTNAGSSYGTVTLNTAGNASITDSVGDLVVDTSTVGGTLYVKNTSGNISQLGALTVTGNTTFVASNAASSLTLNNTSNQFGAFKFNAGTGGSLINEQTTFNLAALSSSTGAVTINTGGDFVTSGQGGSTFWNTLKINATGNITPSANSLFVNNTLTLITPANANLSALSLSANLGGIAPDHSLVAGTYTAPAP